MAHERKTPSAGEIDVGYLAGRVDHIDDDVREVKEDMRRMWERLDFQTGMLTEVKARQQTTQEAVVEMKDLLKKSVETDKHRVRTAPVAPEASQSAVALLIRHPAFAYLVALAAVVAMGIACLSALSDRPAKDLVPFVPGAPSSGAP